MPIIEQKGYSMRTSRKRRSQWVAEPKGFISAQGVCAQDFLRGQSNLQKAGSVLESLARELGLDGALKLHDIRDQWANVFKRPLSLHTYPSTLIGENLFVNVDSPVWLQEINFLKSELIEKLRPFGVKDIKFRLGKVSP
jgi:hypothetical protein